MNSQLEGFHFEDSPREALEGNASVAFYLHVHDVDQSYTHAVNGGMTSVSEPEDMFGGARAAVVSDPFGYSCSYTSHVKEVSMEKIEKEVTAMSA